MGSKACMTVNLCDQRLRNTEHWEQTISEFRKIQISQNPKNQETKSQQTLKSEIIIATTIHQT